MTKQEEAIAVLEHVARSIEIGTLVLSPLMQQQLGEQYASDLAKSVPVSMREAIDTLKDPDKTSQMAETTDQR